MNSFDDKWKRLTSRARSMDDGLESPPYGFATRVVARWPLARADNSERIWEQLGLKAAGWVSLAFLILITVEFTGAPRASGLAPHLEETVSQVFWIL